MTHQGFLNLMVIQISKRIAQAIAVSGCKIDRKRGFKHMFKFLFNNKEEGDIVMSNTRLSKTQKIKNLFERGATVTWKQLRTVYDLKSPAAMIGKLRNQGLMIYENRSRKTGVSYRVGRPSTAILVAGMNKVFGKQVGYSA